MNLELIPKMQTPSNQWRMTHFKHIPDSNIHIIHINFYQHKTPDEISVKLNVETNTVKYIIKQFKQILRRRAQINKEKLNKKTKISHAHELFIKESVIK